MKKMVLFGALIAAAGVAQAAEWWPMQGTASEVWFIDRSSLSGVSGSRIGWLRIETKASSVAAGGVKRELKKMGAHCKSGTLQRLINFEYAANGSVISSDYTAGYPFEYVPDSIGETFYKFMCGQKKNWPTQHPASDPVVFTETYFSIPDESGAIY